MNALHYFGGKDNFPIQHQESAPQTSTLPEIFICADLRVCAAINEAITPAAVL